MNNKFKTLARTWNKEFELLDGSYSISDVHYYFENIYIFLHIYIYIYIYIYVKKHGEKLLVLH